MAKWKKTTVCCPACLQEGNFQICSFVDAEEDSDLKESIFNRNLFRYSCPECGEEILVAYDCTYFDKENNFMVSLIPEKDDTTIETTCYTLRVVRSINEFVEKIALMEDGLDDRIVEIYKIMLEDQFEEERPGDEILGIYYGGQNPDDKSLLFFIITSNAENVRAMLSYDVYSSITNQFDKVLSPDDENTSEINRSWALMALNHGFGQQSE